MKKILVVFLFVVAIISCGGGENPNKPFDPFYRNPDPHEVPADGGDGPTASGQGVNMWAIDMTVLKVGADYYAVWSGWDKYYEAREGNGQYLYIASMTFHNDKPLVRLGERHLLASPDLPWEIKVGEAFSLLEGPCVVYHGDDIFLLYSTRGSWTVNYKIGVMKLMDKSDPLNPASWQKKSTPFFSGLAVADGKGSYGAGHCSVTMSPDDTEYWLNFHTKTSTAGGWDDRKVFFQKFSFGPDGFPVMDKQADPSQPMARPSGEYEIEKSDGVQSPSPTFMNPVRDGADPWITKVEGYYYVSKSGDYGVRVSKSRFMTKFEDGKTYAQAAKTVWKCPMTPDKWNEKNLWAPEIHFINGKWYIFYAAGHQSQAPYWQHRSGVLVSSDGPQGHYVEHDTNPLFTGE